MRRLIIRASPIASESTLTSPRSGHELAVAGSFLSAAVEVCAAGFCAAGFADGAAAAGADETAGADGAGAAAGGAPALPAAGVARVACTSFSVMIRGGPDVTMVAD